MKKVSIILVLFLLAVISVILQEMDTNAVGGVTGGHQSISPSGDSGEKVDLPEADPALGEKIYNQACSVCHKSGLLGAQKIGDTEAWKPKIEKGLATLYQNVINGYQGSVGYMPPRGGYPDLTDQEIVSALVYMVEKSR